VIFKIEDCEASPDRRIYLIVGLETTSQNLISLKWRYDSQHNDAQHNDAQHNDAQHNDAQHNDIQHNNTQHNDIQHNGK
jgi:hypothetical protein